MKDFKIILIFSILLVACNQAGKKNVNIKKIEVQNIDLYPRYHTCPDYFEKEKQLECLMLKINSFITYHLNEKYRKEFESVTDTLWIKFEIDTTGQIHYINVIHFKDRFKDSLHKGIFNKIAQRIPKLKPAIYQGKPVNFEFKIPVVHYNQ